MLPQAVQEQIVGQIIEFNARSACKYHKEQKDHDDLQMANQVSELVALTIFVFQGNPQVNESFAQMLQNYNGLTSDQVQLIFQLVAELSNHRRL